MLCLNVVWITIQNNHVLCQGPADSGSESDGDESDERSDESSSERGDKTANEKTANSGDNSGDEEEEWARSGQLLNYIIFSHLPISFLRNIPTYDPQCCTLFPSTMQLMLSTKVTF